MSFQFQCPQGHLLEGQPAQAGQQINCPMCGILFIIPAPLSPGPSGPAPAPGRPPGPYPVTPPAPAPSAPSAPYPGGPPSPPAPPGGPAYPPPGPPASPQSYAGQPAPYPGQPAPYPGQPAASGAAPSFPPSPHPGPPAPEPPSAPQAAAPDPQWQPHQSFEQIAEQAGGGAAQAEAAAVEPEEELLHIPCPNGHELESPRDMLGQDVLCPHCDVQFQLREKDSVEAKRKRRHEREARDRKVGNLWLNWAIVIAVVVVLGLLVLIFSSTMS